MQNCQITKIKNPADTYVIRNPHGDWLCTVMLEDDTGTVVIYGPGQTLGYSWTNPGRGDRSLKSFLRSANTAYIADKMMAGIYGMGIGQVSYQRMERKAGGLIEQIWPVLMATFDSEDAAGVPAPVQP